MLYCTSLMAFCRGNFTLKVNFSSVEAYILEYLIYLQIYQALCSRNVQNVNFRLHSVEILQSYCHSNFTWNQILGNSNGQKMSFLAILEFLNFDFSKFEQLSSPTFTKNSKFRVSNALNDIFGPFEFPKIWFHVRSVLQ